VDLLRDRLARVQLAAGDDDVGAGPRESERHLAAEAARAAGDDGDPVGEVERADGALVTPDS
jgi:hypothetical protein